ncbi:dihydroorotate dehydrogenase [Paenibacillus apiarius]|uniref:Dihydroorotate dehydrogenase n=1 Tax=Paenibacillus apiarius TaxID=46240 RepID=A0ABT4DU60_9BACL|nr:dihydroorotate dehydrogenase [Paenibacillus apiarius]MBN3527417.1 dihydroorotate dehydrogenase [Paenibacillus apiarius]MCY9515973.1 dihydroorotate dehydrogenase [Paenibacillus apiarius]MCY9520883.1 dihydroorotate dehydrogenase [Paenibacillus apiarius]MCY9553588.1 dihydroorotate dehydrogenase [Paenibacillus apiarius]MCY9557889.1 dihydroorotate dehydrogenase [Paenibacillus apiarius]
MRNLACNVAGIPFKNPIVMASGTFGFGQEYAKLYDINKLGGISCKGLTLHPRKGNPGTRVWETAGGMLNSVGLENPGIDAFLEEEMKFWETIEPVKIANLGGSNIEEYVLGALKITKDAEERRRQNQRAVDMIELNISCPNVKEGGMAFGVKTAVAREVIREVRQVTSLPLAVKLSPNAENIVDMAVMCEDEGAECVSLVNTFSGMKIDIYQRRSVFHNMYAGLSGPSIKPVALRMVHQVAQQVTIPVMGMGGIASASDVIEFIMAGAEVVQVGTYNFMNLRAGEELLAGIRSFMELENIQSLDEIRGIIQ